MLFNGYSKIRLIDNREHPGMYVEGYSHFTDQVSPNRGIIIESEIYEPTTEIYFYEYGVVKGDEVHYVKDSNIIIANGKLRSAGALCARVTLEKRESGIIMHDAIDYLQVLYTNIAKVKRGDLVVIAKSQFQWINYWINNAYRRVTYVQPQGILLVLSRQHGVIAGPGYTIKESAHNTKGGQIVVTDKKMLSFTQGGIMKSVVPLSSVCLQY